MLCSHYCPVKLDWYIIVSHASHKYIFILTTCIWSFHEGALILILKGTNEYPYYERVRTPGEYVVLHGEGAQSEVEFAVHRFLMEMLLIEELFKVHTHSYIDEDFFALN